MRTCNERLSSESGEDCLRVAEWVALEGVLISIGSKCSQCGSDITAYLVEGSSTADL